MPHVAVLARAPGRVNLIGEHTDHQEGFVLPMAIGLATTLRARARGDGVVALESDAFPGRAEFGRGDDPVRVEPSWARTPCAVVHLLRRAGLPIFGFDGVFTSTLPPGGGLSSSAALCVATALAAAGIARALESRIPPMVDDPAALAAICRDAEALGAGVRCGIMDPFASLRGRAGAALRIDCRTLDVQEVPVPSERMLLVVADSGVRHALAASGYGMRRAECEEAARRLGVATLRDAKASAVAAARDRLGPELHRRARHVVLENSRVAVAAHALSMGNAEAFGVLLDDSHTSLRNDFEVSCSELDDLVAAAREVPGVLGSRMCGGGFGGSTVTAVRPDAAPRLLEALAAHGARIVAPSGPAHVERIAWT